MQINKIIESMLLRKQSQQLTGWAYQNQGQYCANSYSGLIKNRTTINLLPPLKKIKQVPTLSLKKSQSSSLFNTRKLKKNHPKASASKQCNQQKPLIDLKLLREIQEKFHEEKMILQIPIGNTQISRISQKNEETEQQWQKIIKNHKNVQNNTEASSLQKKMMKNTKSYQIFNKKTIQLKLNTLDMVHSEADVESRFIRSICNNKEIQQEANNTQKQSRKLKNKKKLDSVIISKMNQKFKQSFRKKDVFSKQKIIRDDKPQKKLIENPQQFSDQLIYEDTVADNKRKFSKRVNLTSKLLYLKFSTIYRLTPTPVLV